MERGNPGPAVPLVLALVGARRSLAVVSARRPARRPEEGPAREESGAATAAQGPLRVSLAALDAPLLARLLPERVVTPLVGDGFDALDVAERLSALGFRGRLEVLCPALPDRRLIRAEIAAACPGVELRFVTRVAGGPPADPAG